MTRKSCLDAHSLTDDEREQVTANRLLELLEIRENEISELEQQLEEMRRALEHGVEWMLHSSSKEDVQGVPAPRLQLRLVEEFDYSDEWSVELVLKTRFGQFEAVPLSYAKVSRSHPIDRTVPESLDSDEMQRLVGNMLPSALSDLCFAHEQMHLPAFVVMGDTALQITAVRPFVRLAHVRAAE